jgi:hypothetical protein
MQPDKIDEWARRAVARLLRHLQRLIARGHWL